MSIDADEERRDREGQNGAAASTSGSSKRPHFPGWSVAWARWKATVEPLTRKLDPGELASRPSVAPCICDEHPTKRVSSLMPHLACPRSLPHPHRA